MFNPLKETLSHVTEPFTTLKEWGQDGMQKRVYEFNEGSIDDRHHLGIKGAYLCEMTKHHLPVPPGFIITSEACQDFFSSSRSAGLAPHLKHNLRQAVEKLEKKTNKSFKSTPQPQSSIVVPPTTGLSTMLPPLLLSVRSSTGVKLPGMTDTILNLGINDKSCALLGKHSNSGKFALDVHWRFLMMFGTVVMKVPQHQYDEVLKVERAACGVGDNSQLDIKSLQVVVHKFKKLAEVPEDPLEQLFMAVDAIFCSWYNESAVKYREMNNLDETAGTAIVIQEMVFGNMNAMSCTGVVFSRNPSTGERVLDGEFCHGEGEDVNAGRRETHHINELKNWGATDNEERERGGPVFQELTRLVGVLENLFRDVQEVEFTVQDSDIFILQSGSATRSPKANVKFAVQMVNEGLITERDSLLGVNALQMDYFLKPVVHPHLDPDTLSEKLLGTGLPGVSSGAVTGEAVFTEEAAEQCYRDGRPCILIRNDASAADLHGIAAADGIICLEGGASSYLVEICRPMNRTCVVGAKLSGLSLVKREANTESQEASSWGVYDNFWKLTIVEGQIITLDGSTGRIFDGPVLVVEEGMNNAFRTILRWAEKYKRLSIVADISSPEDCYKNLDFGSDGIGLLRVENFLLLGKKREAVLDYLIAYGRDKQNFHSAEAASPSLLTKRNIHSLRLPPPDTSFAVPCHPSRHTLLQALEHALLPDLKGIFEASLGNSVAVALLNTSLNSFLPPVDALRYTSSHGADKNLLDELASRTNTTPQDSFSIIEALRDLNPLLGVKGCRFSLVNPEFMGMQVRAALGAGLQVIREGQKRMGTVQFMIPMISSEHETLELVNMINVTSEEFFAAQGGQRLDFSIGVVVQTPRACVRMDRISRIPAISKVMFDCDALTELVFGMSRVDTESMLEVYMAGTDITTKNPFDTLDRKGVGAFINMAIRLFRSQKSRESHSSLIGVCGNQTGYPVSIEFFASLDIDFICCSPDYLPTAKVAAAQSHIKFTKRQEQLMRQFAWTGYPAVSFEMGIDYEFYSAVSSLTSFDYNSLNVGLLNNISLFPYVYRITSIASWYK